MKRLGVWQHGTRLAGLRTGALTLALMGAAGLSGCKRGEAVVQEIAPELAEAEQRTLDIRAEAAGLVEPIATVEIKSKASGEVTNVHVESGQEVKRGTLLAEIEPRDVQNAFAQAEADLEVAAARAATSEAQFKRVQELRRANVATEQELESSMLDQANSKAALVKAQTALLLTKERLNDITIRAPMDGTIIERTVEPGAIIASASNSVSGGAILMKMADLSMVQVRALIDQTDIGRVQPGLAARVSVEAYPSRVFDGQVVKIEPQAVVDQNVTMFPVLIRLNNEDRLLKPGMNTEIEIEIARRPNAIVIPNDAVVNPRDVVATGVALGMTEDVSTQRAEAMRSMRATPVANTPGGSTAGQASPVEQTAQNPAANGATAGQNPQGREGAAGGGRQGDTTPTPECQAVSQRVREATESGRQPTDEDRAKQRTCNAQSVGRTNRPATVGRGRGGRGGPGGGGGRGGGASSIRPRPTNRPGVVFLPGPNGPEPRQVTLGYSDLDYTEVVSGLKAGEKVYLVTAARLLKQQQDNVDRMRQRMQGPVPGMANPGGGGGPRGGGR
ncbi:MAG: efflux RND transporter periplasmic adaptor subunit [Gemmatimonadota bacterium]